MKGVGLSRLPPGGLGDSTVAEQPVPPASASARCQVWALGAGREASHAKGRDLQDSSDYVSPFIDIVNLNFRVAVSPAHFCLPTLAESRALKQVIEEAGKHDY